MFPHDLPVLEHQQGWDRPDAILSCEGWIVIHIHLAHGGVSGNVCRQVLNDRCHDVARTAPWRPEIDEDRLGAVEDVTLESCLGEGSVAGVCRCHTMLLSLIWSESSWNICLSFIIYMLNYRT